jgi:hypothetical protein
MAAAWICRANRHLHFTTITTRTDLLLQRRLCRLCRSHFRRPCLAPLLVPPFSCCCCCCCCCCLFFLLRLLLFRCLLFPLHFEVRVVQQVVRVALQAISTGQAGQTLEQQDVHWGRSCALQKNPQALPCIPTSKPWLTLIHAYRHT